MPTMEFLATINPENYEYSQILPPAYLREGYNGNHHLYLTGHQGYKFKVELTLKRNGAIEVHGLKWKQFVSRHFDDGVRVLHFVEEGEDSFYVTGYNAMGIEYGGYEGVTGRMTKFMTRHHTYPNIAQTIDASFLELEVPQNGEIHVLANGIMLPVRVQRVNGGMFEISSGSWNNVVETLELEMGMKIVFAKNPFNRLFLMAFDSDGTAHTDVIFHGAIRLRRVQLPLEYHELNDDRMTHICQWDWHRDHYQEDDDTFYKTYASTVDKQRLTIPADFCDEHHMNRYRHALMKHKDYERTMVLTMVPHSDRPGRTNHIAMYGKWKQFARDCSFAYNKVMRFRLMHFINDVDNEEQIPVFHIC